MDELIARLENTTGPDRELFKAAYVARFGEVDWGNYGGSKRFCQFIRFVEVEAWEQAALMLLPEGMDCEFSSEHCDGFIIYRAEIGSSPLVRLKSNFATAIAIAALKARAALPPQSNKREGK